MNSLKWKRRIATIFPSKKNISRKIILIYHAVGKSPWAIPVENFKKQMQWLNQNCKIVSLTQLLKNKAIKNDIQVAITFDDGYACLYDTVLPILKAENAVATVYINTGWMGDESHKISNPDLGHYPNENFLTWNEVQSLSDHGWEIGSHGVEHIDLTKQTVEVVKKELLNSKLAIETFLQTKCQHFAYTWGRHNTALEKEVSLAGYQYAVAAQHGILRSCDNQFALPRMNVALEYNQNDFENMINGHLDFLAYIHQLKKKLKMDHV